MEKISWRALAFAGLVLFAALVAGCSDEAAAPPADVAPAVTTAAGPLYGAGDLVKNPQSTAGTAVLIIRYDAGSDKYERAYVYPNSDGSLGYRLDSKTDLIERSMIERTYSEKIRTVAVSSIPVGSTTTVATTIVTTTTTKGSSVTTTTTTKGYAPKITGVEPDKGKTGETVSITELTGQNFLSGANVTLKKGSSQIHATDVVVTPTLITCKFAIPSSAALDYWDMIVKNSDGQYDTYQNAFLVQQGTATTTTTTTSSSATSMVTISSVLTPKVVTGGSEALHQPVQIMGTNLSSVSKMKLTRGSTVLTSTFYHMTSGSIAEAFFDIPGGATNGLYSVSLVDTDNAVLASKTDAVNICSNC